MSVFVGEVFDEGFPDFSFDVGLWVFEFNFIKESTFKGRVKHGGEVGGGD